MRLCVHLVTSQRNDLVGMLNNVVSSSAWLHKLILPNFLAKVGLGIFAEFAFTTLWHIQWDDSITLKKKKCKEVKLIQELLT